MIVSINTKEDSNDEIRRMIEMLQRLLSDRGGYSGYGSNNANYGSVNSESGVRNIFSDPPSSTGSNQSSMNNNQNSGDIFSMFNDDNNSTSNTNNFDSNNYPKIEIIKDDSEKDDKDYNITVY